LIADLSHKSGLDIIEKYVNDLSSLDYLVNAA
jgi:hypothetical protein